MKKKIKDVKTFRALGKYHQTATPHNARPSFRWSRENDDHRDSPRTCRDIFMGYYREKMDGGT